MSTTPSALTPDGGDLFDLGQGKLWVGFVLRSIRRHRRAFFATFLTLGALGSFLALATPKQYLSQTRLLARYENGINNVTVPNQNIGSNTDSLAALGEPTIKAETNLEKIVDELRLVERYEISETRFGRMKRRTMEKVFGARTAAKKREDVIGLLRQNLSVTTEPNDKTTINVAALWTDPVIAQEIASAANKNFLADRRAAEVGVAEAAVGIAQAQLAKVSAEVAQLRVDLNIPEIDDRPLPESSPLRGQLAIETEYKTRVADAETQLKNTAAQFQYRYQVITPPEVPVAPVSGSMSSVLLSLIAGAIVGAAVTTLLDIVRGRVVEPWQVSRRLNLPLLAELPS